MNILEKNVIFIADAFPNLQTPKNVVRYMSKKTLYRKPFNKQHGKPAQTLFKSERRQFYHIYWLLWKELSLKKSLLVICKILRLFINIFTADDKYSLHFSAFSKSRLSFEDFEEIDDPQSWCISENTDLAKRG